MRSIFSFFHTVINGDSTVKSNHQFSLMLYFQEKTRFFTYKRRIFKFKVWYNEIVNHLHCLGMTHAKCVDSCARIVNAKKIKYLFSINLVSSGRKNANSSRINASLTKLASRNSISPLNLTLIQAIQNNILYL